MKIYTRTGDSGMTSLVGGTRVSKASVRLEAYGTVDELNASIGLLMAMEGVPDEHRRILLKVQHLLFNLGSELATEPASTWRPKMLEAQDVEMLERAIDGILPSLPPQFRFVLPGGSLAAAQANVARTVARRCERRMVEMNSGGEPVADNALKFVNRLSDYLFALGRLINIASGNDEIFWQQ